MKLETLSLAVMLAIATSAMANPLDEIWYSKEMSDFRQGIMADPLTGVPKGTNYETALMQPLTMLQWIWKDAPNFRQGKRNMDFFSAGKIATQSFETGQKGVFKENHTLRVYVVTILATLPKYKMNYEAGIIPEIAALQPPKLKVESVEPVDINGNPASLFYKSDGTCSILLKLTKNVVVNIDGESCSNVRELIDFGRMLDVKRLQDKLDT